MAYAMSPGTISFSPVVGNASLSTQAKDPVSALLNGNDPLPNFEKNAAVYDAIRNAVFSNKYPHGSEEAKILNTWLDAHSISSSSDKVAKSKKLLSELLQKRLDNNLTSITSTIQGLHLTSSTQSNLGATATFPITAPITIVPPFTQKNDSNAPVSALLNGNDPLPNFEKNAAVYDAIRNAVFSNKYPHGSEEAKILNTWLDAHSISSSSDKVAKSKKLLSELLQKRKITSSVTVSNNANPKQDILIPLKDQSVRKNEPVKKLSDLRSMDLKKTDGRFKFVIRQDGDAYISYDNDNISHNALAKNEKDSVLGAGIIQVDSSGKIVAIHNYSGHYKPSPVNAFYSFHKMAEQLGLNPNDHEVAVGLSHTGGSFNGYSYPVMSIVRKGYSIENLAYHAKANKLFYREETFDVSKKEMVANSPVLAKGISLGEFEKLYSENEQFRGYFERFNEWKMREENGSVTGSYDHPNVNKQSNLFKFLQFMGFENNLIEKMILNMPKGKSEM